MLWNEYKEHLAWSLASKKILLTKTPRGETKFATDSQYIILKKGVA